jgi:hypothetical protein
MKYTVTAPAARFAAGVLSLTGEQAARRKHALRHLKDDRYEITAPVEFKAGEVIGYDGDMPKALAVLMEPAEKPAKKARPAKTDEAPAATEPGAE